MEEKIKQTVLVKDRESLVADGVIDVESFAQDYVLINTKYGKLNVEGENLKINQLNQEDGKISICGEISGVFFKDEMKSQGFFKKIFK